MIQEDALNPTVETKLAVLSQWWQRHCQAFSLWFLALSDAQREEVVLRACPDLPRQSPFTREAAGEVLRPTDIILPEFSQEGMFASQGRIFILFVTRRLSSRDRCMADDVKLLSDLFGKGHLPSFSNHALDSMDTPFVDPVDPEENIRSLSAATTAESRALVSSHLSTGRLIHAEVWLALKIRRLSICSLLEAVAEEHYKAAQTKPSPSYASLLAGELEQQKTLLEEEALAAEETTSKEDSTEHNS
eukprot:gene7212-7978_t